MPVAHHQPSPPFPPRPFACDSTVEKAWHLIAGDVEGSIRSSFLLSTRNAVAEDTTLSCNVFRSNCKMEANVDLGPTPTYMLVLFLHRFHRRACCPSFLFPMSRIRTSSRVNPEQRVSPALLDAGTELWVKEPRRDTKTLSPSSSMRRTKCGTLSKTAVFMLAAVVHAQDLSSTPFRPTSKTTSRPFVSIRAVPQRLPLCS